MDDENELVAVITRESAEALELAIDVEILALVKSSSILLLTDPAIKTTARNHLWGQITRIHDGPVNAGGDTDSPGQWKNSVCRGDP